MPTDLYFSLPQEKKGQIKKAVYDEYINKTYDKVTTRSLIEKAGISNGSFYRYFESKDKMYIYFINELVDKSYGKLVDVFTYLITDFYSNTYLSPIENAYMNTLFNAPDEVLKKYYFDEYNKNHVALLEKQVSNMQENGKLSKELSVHLYTHLLITTSYNIFMYVRKNGITDPVERQELYVKAKCTQMHIVP